MSRNSEKAQSMLFRFREQQAAEMGSSGFFRLRRPKLIHNVNSISDCERWRGQVVRDISRKVSQIQDPALSDYQIRDINDEINKLMREKYAWEIQIRKLGGPNFIIHTTTFDDQGREIPSNKGYKYFGRARELPGVKEILEAQREKLKPKNKKQNDVFNFNWNVNPDYYGYRDDENSKLIEYESNLQEKLSEIAEKEHGPHPSEDILNIPMDFDIPSQKKVESTLIEWRKAKIRNTYTL